MSKKKLIENIVHLDLPVKLTDSEIADMSRKYCKLRDEVFKAEIQFAKVKEQYKGEIAKVDFKMNVIIGKIAKGAETRTVKCIEHIDKGKTVRVVRVDTGEEVKKIGQPVLPLETSKPAANDKKAIDRFINDLPGRKFKRFAGDDSNGVQKWEPVEFKNIDRINAFRIVDPNGTEFKDPAGNNYFRAKDRAKKGEKGVWFVDVIPSKVVFKK